MRVDLKAGKTLALIGEGYLRTLRHAESWTYGIGIDDKGRLRALKIDGNRVLAR